MTINDEFTRRLIQFGLSEKEAQTYLYLLKYGPKTPSPLAKSLKTYREDVHRTLTSLVDKGMVRPSLSSPTVYAAVSLDTALEAALKKQESELREMEARKRELHELYQHQHFTSSGGEATFKITKSLKELIATVVPAITTLEKQWDMVVPEKAVIVASRFGINQFTEAFVTEGGNVRIVISDFSYAVIPMVQELIDIGAEVRYSAQGEFAFAVFDKKNSLSGINWEILRHVALDQPITAFWTDDPIYAQYLSATFEIVWKLSILAEKRIQELLEQGPPHA
ncbi:MAG: TrmB family transcriptional regulator [Halobacteriota archaeon]